MDADEIIVLENGQVADRGSHDSLLHNKSGLYWQLWDTQNQTRRASDNDDNNKEYIKVNI